MTGEGCGGVEESPCEGGVDGWGILLVPESGILGTGLDVSESELDSGV